LKKETTELLTWIYLANTRNQKTDVLQIARELIKVIRLLIRVNKDMKKISLEKFAKVNQAVEIVSKQLAGWQKCQIKVFKWECASLPPLHQTGS
jgi:predicted translin family RNA/ssDNA-binding protein